MGDTVLVSVIFFLSVIFFFSLCVCPIPAQALAMAAIPQHKRIIVGGAELHAYDYDKSDRPEQADRWGHGKAVCLIWILAM